MKKQNKSKIKNKKQLQKYMKDALKETFNAEIVNGKIKFSSGEVFDIDIEEMVKYK